MQASKPKLNWKTILLPIVGLAAFFVYILLFNVDIPEILSTAEHANPVIYSAAILVSLAEVFFYAISWRSLLKYLQVKISVIRSYLFVWYGTFMDIVIPAESVSGELCRIFLVNREQCGTGGKVAASVIIQRVLGMAINVLFLIVGIYLLSSNPQVNPVVFNLILFFAVAITAIIGMVLLISTKEKWSTKVITSLIRAGEWLTRGKWKQLNHFKQDALKDLKAFHDSMTEFVHKPKALILPTTFLLVNWVCSISIPYLVFLSLGFEPSWSVILITSSIVVAVKSIPIGVPFEVGLPEMTMTTLYTSMGIPAGIGATSTILSRLITLWLRFGVGFGAQQLVEVQFALTPRKGKATEKT